MKIEKKVNDIPEKVLINHCDLQVILFLVRQLGSFCSTCEKEFRFNVSTLQHENLGHICCMECHVFHYCSKNCFQNRQLFIHKEASASCKTITNKKAKWKLQILQKISLPITARLKILSIRGKYDLQMCSKCELYKECGSKYGRCTGCQITKYCSKSAKSNIGRSINQFVNKLVIS